jgi:diketogulonate reductase-like aldo/keto reductase
MTAVRLQDGTEVPALGQGTWRMGERRGERAQEVRALRLGLDLGMTLIDTAEMYGEGAAEEVVGEAIAGRREEVFLVSKAYPHNASRRKLEAACAASLKRLGVEALDLYLLHWRGSVPLAETVEAMEALVAKGMIRRWGVSNLDVADLREMGEAQRRCAANQVLYSLEERGVEFDLLAHCEAFRMAVMAYCPIGQGGALLRNPALRQVAERHGATPARAALAWLLRRPGIIAIPKASDEAHVRDNAAARDLRLTEQDLAQLDAAFPPPRRKQRLGMV